MVNKAAGRRLFSVGESYGIMVKALRTMPYLRRARSSGVLNEAFAERLMLAVTEVNQCALCSYAHTKMALEMGLEKSEIEALLAGDSSGLHKEEMPAILFAQHYADTRGKPSPQAWDALLKEYGTETAMGMLAAVRIMMMGNAYGIPSGSLMGRFSRKSGRKPDPRSNIGYELAMLLTLPVLLLCAMAQAFIAKLLKLPVEPT